MKNQNDSPYIEQVTKHYVDKFSDINKDTLAACIADRYGDTLPYTKADINAIISALAETIKDLVCRGKTVTIRGFCIFETVIHEERKCPNPRTGETMLVPRTYYPKIRSGNDFKARVKELPLPPLTE